MSSSTLSPTATPVPIPTPTTRSLNSSEKQRVILGVGVGNALEWYDWTAYSIFATYFAHQFFHSADPIAAILGTLAVFAVGFFMRPLGGIFFGWLADKKGRRSSMTLSMLITAGGSFLIGISPTYETIGPFAALFLLSGRLLQGIGHGGEVVSSFTYVTEMAPKKSRGLWSSSVFIFVTLGVLSAVLLSATLTSILGVDAVKAWAWRIPFILGGLLGVYALYLRKSLDETPMFKAQKNSPAPRLKGKAFCKEVWQHRRACLRVFALSAGGTVLYYVWAVMAPTFAITALGMPAKSVMWVGVGANLFLIVCLFCWGYLSDRLGRKFNWYFFSIGSIICILPLTHLLTSGNGEVWRLAVFMGIGILLISAPTAIMPAFFPEQFPTHIRAIAMGMPYAIAGAITGGTAPYLQAWLYSIQKAQYFDYYLIFLCTLTLIATFYSPETRGKELTD